MTFIKVFANFLLLSGPNVTKKSSINLSVSTYNRLKNVTYLALLKSLNYHLQAFLSTRSKMVNESQDQSPDVCKLVL